MLKVRLVIVSYVTMDSWLMVTITTGHHVMILTNAVGLPLYTSFTESVNLRFSFSAI